MMDKPIQGANLSPAHDVTKKLGPAANPGRVSTEAGRTRPENTTQPRTQAERVEQTSGLPNITTRESALPLAILKSPLLMQTEWAWRRLLVNVASEMWKRPTPSPMQSPSQPLPGESHGQPATPAGSRESNPGTGLAKGVQQYQSAVSPMRHAARSPEEGGLDLRGESVASTPVRHEHDGMSPPGGPQGGLMRDDIGSNLPVVQAAVKTLWQTLSAFTENQSQTQWQADLPSDFEPGSMIPFAALQGHQVPLVPDKVIHWTLADRLVASTKTPDMPLAGGGMFVLPTRAEPRRNNAVRWQAERKTRVTSQGQPVHHLKLSVMVDAEPVEMHLICAKPSLAIRVETNHGPLKTRLERGQSDVSEALKQLGWSLDKWSLNPLTREEERP